MYIIYQQSNGQWVLRLRAKHLVKLHYFNKYIDALDAAQLLQFRLNKYDRRGQILRKAA